MNYSQYDPFKVHFINGQPVIYNKNDNPISIYDAENAFTKAFNTLRTHASRVAHLAAAQPVTVQTPMGDFNARETHLERFENELENIEEWCQMLRRALDREKKKEKDRQRVSQLRAKADSTTFPEEADAFRAKADELEKNYAQD